MIPIDLTDNPWHWRFIKFMRLENRFRFYFDEQNTCSYARTFMLAAFQLMIFSALAFLVPYSLVHTAIVVGIFVYTVGFSLLVIQSALHAIFILFALISAFITVVSGAIGIGILCACILTAGNKGITAPPAFQRMRARFRESSSYQIAQAWHSKICRPIKLPHN